jgi:hypothetical protein
MAESTESTAKTVVERASELSDEVRESAETGLQTAKDAVRKFVDTVEEAVPALVDPLLRKKVVDAALDMARTLGTAQSEFLRSAARSASESLTPGRPTSE